MHKKQLAVTLTAASVFIISGCMISTTKNPHIGETTLTWYAYASANTSEDNAVKEEYRKKIDQYLLHNPQTNKEIAEKMKNCRVILGMTEEQVLTMAKPNRISKAGRNKKIFKYSDVGKFGWTGFIGEGVRINIIFTNGVVTDISEIDRIFGS